MPYFEKSENRVAMCFAIESSLVFMALRVSVKTVCKLEMSKLSPTPNAMKGVDSRVKNKKDKIIALLLKLSMFCFVVFFNLFILAEKRHFTSA